MSFGRRALLASGLLAAVSAALVLGAPSIDSRARDTTAGVGAATRAAPHSTATHPAAPLPTSPTTVDAALEVVAAAPVQSSASASTRPARDPAPGRIDAPAAAGVPGREAGLEGRVEGRVEDADGAPIRGATLHALDELGEPVVGRTDEAGRFALGSCPPLLEARAPGHAAQRRTRPGTTGELVFRLSRGALLQGRVLGREENRPLPGARVEGSSGDWAGATTTDICGLFSLDDAPAGRAVTVRVTARGRLPRVVATTVSPGGRELVVALERGATARGRVVDEAGAPVAACVHVFAEEGLPAPQETESDGHGRFEVSGLPPGARVAVVALTPRLASRVDSLEWRALDAEARVVVRPRGALLVTGLPEGTFELRALGAPGELPLLDRRLDGDGVSPVRAARLVPGRYQLHRDGTKVGSPIEVAAGETVETKLEPSEGTPR